MNGMTGMTEQQPPAAPPPPGRKHRDRSGVAGAAPGHLGALLVAGAVTAIVLGIAAQQTLGNFFAGLVLLFARPYRATGEGSTAAAWVARLRASSPAPTWPTPPHRHPG